MHQEGKILFRKLHAGVSKRVGSIFFIPLRTVLVVTSLLALSDF